MQSFIENLRKKPKGTRKRISLIAASLITFFIFAFWVVSVPSRLGQEEFADLTPYENIKNDMASVYTAFESTFEDLSLSLKSLFNREQE